MKKDGKINLSIVGLNENIKPSDLVFKIFPEICCILKQLKGH